MKRLFLILVAFYAIYSYTLASPTYIESGIAYKVIDDQTVVVCASDCSDSMYVKTDSTLIIPSHVVLSGKEYNVKGIDKAAYAKCGWIKHLIISEGVEKIQSDAFLACANLEDVVLPSSIKALDYCVFSYCLNLSSIKVDEHKDYQEE